MTIHLCNLTVGYSGHPAIHHLNAEIARGSMVALLGPNGSGKSTLLKAIMGMVRPYTGHVVIDFQKNMLLKKKVAYLPQITELNVDFPITVEEIVAYGHWQRVPFWRPYSAQQKQDVAAALVRVGMQNFAKNPIRHLSVGQLQRVLFARIIVQNADLLLLDEPFSAIDSRTAEDLLLLMQDWHKEGRTIVSVIHDKRLAEVYFPSSMILARELIAFGKTADVLTDANLQKAFAESLTWQEKGVLCPVQDDILHRHDDHDHHHTSSHKTAA
jgi:zinc/manganese transport system ATP-binding protein